jgi:hypothetical protein
MTCRQSKSARFVARAVEFYIGALMQAISHMHPEDDVSMIENDIALYRSVLPTLQAGRWPQNPDDENAP